MLAELLVNIYRFVHGKLHLPGAGWLIRLMLPIVPRLKNYTLTIPSVGSVPLDFRDIAAFGLVNFTIGDYGDDKFFLPVIDEFLADEQVLWDIGANIGYFSLYFVLPPHKLRSIYCFEPNPRAYEKLHSLFQKHPTVKAFQYGLGATDEELEMSVSETGSQLGSFTRKVDPTGSVKVPVRRGDQLREKMQLELPDVIKIDVEGFEPQVLLGLQKTIQASRPFIFFEHIWLSTEQVLAMLPPGYCAYLILDDGSITDDLELKSQSNNGIFVPSEKKHKVENSRFRTAVRRG